MSTSRCVTSLAILYSMSFYFSTIQHLRGRCKLVCSSSRSSEGPIRIQAASLLDQASMVVDHPIQTWIYVVAYQTSVIQHARALISVYIGFTNHVVHSDLRCVLSERSTICSTRTLGSQHLVNAWSSLQKCGLNSQQIWCSELQVPILRINFNKMYEDLQVDININNFAGIRNSHLVHYYSRFGICKWMPISGMHITG